MSANVDSSSSSNSANVEQTVGAAIDGAAIDGAIEFIIECLERDADASFGAQISELERQLFANIPDPALRVLIYQEIESVIQKRNQQALRAAFEAGAGFAETF